DDRVFIFESAAARPKAEFWTGVEVYPTQQAILDALRAEPDSIDGPPKLEQALLKGAAVPPPDAAVQVPARVEQYAANLVRVSVDAPSAGVLVLKDSYFPGWRAELNGQPAEVFRAEGLVRGVLIPGAGHYDVRFTYLPGSFVRGLWVSLAAAL